MLESVVTYILAYAFVFAAFYLLGVRGRPRTVRWLLAWGVVLLFVALLVGSAWRDTVNPLIRWGAWGEAVWAVAGFLVVLAGLGAVLYGGFRFMQETSWAFGDEAMQRNLAVIRERKKHLPVRLRAARWENLRILWRAWRPGTGWLLVGLGGIGLGGLISGEGEDFLARTAVTLVLLAVGGLLLWIARRDGTRTT